MSMRRSMVFAGAALVAAACADPSTPTSASATADRLSFGGEPAAPFLSSFTPIAASASCTVSGGDASMPLVLPAGYQQTIIASEPDYITNGDMQAWNTKGEHRGRYLYRAHETGPSTGISVTDLKTGSTRMLITRSDWVGLDGIIYTPWGTLLFAEELGSSAGNADPDFPAATAGLVYELDPRTLTVQVRPALGSRAHEGQVIDRSGSYYGISERNGGAIFKFVPTHRGDYSAGRLYALKLTTDLGDRTGPAAWVALDGTASGVNSDVEATAKGATGYGRPEDLEIMIKGRHQIIYAALTSENRVIAIDVSNAAAPVVTTVVKNGVNAPADFTFPDNLAFAPNGELFVSEDPGGSFPGKKIGDDIWVATLNGTGTGLATAFGKFASINDCDAEPTGIIFSPSGRKLFVNIQHRGGDGLDKTVSITRTSNDDDHDEGAER